MSTDPDGRLDDASHARVFQERILPESSLNESTPQAHPKAVILAGQPGAGKGGLARAAERQFGDDIVKIDPDELREFHPQVERFREAHPYTWSGQTHSDASSWATELRDVAVEGRRNLIIDTTLGNADGAIKTIKDLQAKGYDVEVRAIATHRLESELGVNQRFSDSMDRKGYGRYVPEEIRSKVYEALPGNLDKVHAETGVPVRIFNREGQQLYDSRNSAVQPSDAMTHEREARMADPKITKSLSRDYQKELHWNEDLPEKLERNPKVMPPAASNTLQQRSDLKAVESLERDATQVKAADRAVRIEPGAARVTMGLKVAGTAAMAYDAAHTGLETKRQLDANNLTGAQSQLTHFGARNVGMVGGAIAGAKVGAALGIETGPGALATGLAGGIVGAVAGDKVAQAIDEARIFNQRDPQGNTWHLDPKNMMDGWKRTVQTSEIDPNGVPNFHTGEPAYKTQTLKADPYLASQLTYQASAITAEMALAHVRPPKDPYKQPADPSEHGRGKFFDDWTRDPNNKAWSRTVMDLTHGPANMRTSQETAGPEKAAQLERTAQAIIADNHQHSAKGIAERYRESYEHFGSAQYGPMPETVQTALRTPDNQFQASDGHTYTKGQNGQWATPGTLYGTNTANERTRQELDATQQAMKPAGPAQSMTPAQGDPTKTQQHAPAQQPSQNPAQPITKDSSKSEMFQALMASAMKGDMEGIRAVGQAYSQTPEWQNLMTQGREMTQQAQQHAQQQEAVRMHQQQGQQQDEHQQGAPARRLS